MAQAMSRTALILGARGTNLSKAVLQVLKELP